MNDLPFFQNIEECVAHFLVSPPTDATLEIELEADLVAYLDDRSVQLDCSSEVLISAILTMSYQEQQRAA